MEALRRHIWWFWIWRGMSKSFNFVWVFHWNEDEWMFTFYFYYFFQLTRPDSLFKLTWQIRENNRPLEISFSALRVFNLWREFIFPGMISSVLRLKTFYNPNKLYRSTRIGSKAVCRVVFVHTKPIGKFAVVISCLR